MEYTYTLKACHVFEYEGILKYKGNKCLTFYLAKCFQPSVS